MLGSTLDAAGGEAAGQVLFDGHEQDDNGNNGEDGSSEQVLPFDDVVAVENVDADGQRLDGVSGDQTQCHGVFIPCIDEDEDQGGDDAGSGNGQQDLKHGLDTVAAIDGGSLVGLMAFRGIFVPGAVFLGGGKAAVRQGPAFIAGHDGIFHRVDQVGVGIVEIHRFAHGGQLELRVEGFAHLGSVIYQMFLLHNLRHSYGSGTGRRYVLIRLHKTVIKTASFSWEKVPF